MNKRYSFFSALVFSVVLILISGASAFGQKEYTVAQIQGDKHSSPYVGESVRVTGVVTAIRAKSFYIQSPDDKADKDPKTSEGICIYGENSASSVAIGDLVQVDGTVTEFRPQNERIFLAITEITRPTVKTLSKNNPLPAPINLTSAELDPKGKLDQLERFEGMRVRLDAVVVAPTGGFSGRDKDGNVRSNGVFFVTAAGTPRPFREAGIDALSAYFDKLPTTIPTFDMNPEMLRVDSTAQVKAKTLDVPAGATIKDLTGVIEFSRKFYTLMMDGGEGPQVSNIKGFVAASPAGPREVTVASFNIENFFDDETNSSNVQKEEKLSKEVFQGRLNKASLAIRNVLSMPDVLGIVEVENLKVLQKLADKINTDAVAAKQPDPKYVAYLEEGNDIRGIDVGYLIKSMKVKVKEMKQLGKDEKLNYGENKDEKLFDRPPLLLTVEVTGEKTNSPFVFTTIVNHFKSYGGIDDEKDGDRVRNKRRLQAEWLANFIQERAKTDANERMIVCGDLNAFQFNDGYNDLVGILKGKPNANVMVASKAAFTTSLVDLIDSMPDPTGRYSYTFDGSAQALDHILVNKPVYKGTKMKFGYARVDADFPAVWANDTTRPERLSDHDAPILFLSLDPPTN